MQKSWSIATSSGPSVGASPLLCGLTPVDRGIPGSPTGTTALSSMQTIIVLFRFSTTNCFRYWYWVAMYRASRWCNLATWDCTLNLTLKWPINLWAVFTWAFIGWNCKLRNSTLGIQPGINCHPHFYCVNYSKQWKQNTGRGWRICGLLKGHGRALFLKIILELLLKRAAILFTLISKEEN